MAEYALLDFGPSVDTRHIESPIDAADFASFERRFRPLLERRGEIHRTIPGAETWPDAAPAREKILEYYLTLEALDLRRESVYLDVASCVSLFPNYVAETLGASVIRQDLYYVAGRSAVTFPRMLDGPTNDRGFFARLLHALAGEPSPVTGHRSPSEAGVAIDCVGSDACAIPLAEQTVDAIGLHCSLEHFEGDSDGRFAHEAFRLLRPGGALLVIPFYCGFEYQEIFKPEFAAGCQFHRYYDPPSFAERVLSRLPRPFSVEVRYYTNHKEVDPSFYCVYSVCVRKG